VWSSWTPADQKIVRECAQDAAKQQIALVRKLYAEDVDRVRALGVEVHLPTPAEAEQWRIACRRVYSRWKVQTNAPLVSKIEQVVEQSRKS
jgi:TRAP-type C4-dicarboxylate transport system substrate-binding protein